MDIDNLPTLIAGGGIALGFVYKEYVAENWGTLASVSVSMVIGELASRGFYIIKSQCKSSNLKEKYSILDFFSKTEKTAAIAIAPLSAAYLVKYWGDCRKVIAPFSLIYFLYRVNTKPPPIVIKQQYGRLLNGIYYGPAMAYSFFYGYFKIILFPDNGISFQEKLKEYIDAQVGEKGTRINIPDKRLQILIPMSGEGAKNLCDKGGDWIAPTKTPALVKTDRGGVKERSYHNTMYRIKRPDSNDKPVYVVAEYATPIITYLEACKLSGEKDLAGFKKETIRSFYETLKRLVELQSSTNDNVNLILYDDIDEQGNTINVAQILLKAISANQPQEPSADVEIAA